MTSSDYFDEAVDAVFERFSAGTPLEEQAVSEFLIGRPTGATERDELADRVIAALLSHNFHRAVDLVKTLPPTARRAITSAANKAVLPTIRREWTSSHGITRTFRYWTSEEKRNYLRFTNWVVEALSEQFQVCLGYGTVLSIIRDQDLIPHDDDLDILVCVPEGLYSTYRAAVAAMVKHIEAFGFKTRGDYPSHRHIENEKFCVDVFVGQQEGEHVSWHPGPRRVLLASDVFPATVSSLYGMPCLVPNDAERYLEVVYGPGWRVPQPGWSHSFDPVPYMDWFIPKKDESRLHDDPKDDRASESIRTPEPKVTAESLGLGPEAEIIGQDPFGRCWFKIPGAERRVYDAKKGQLYRATQRADGEWTLEKVASPPDRAN